eukprot:COSAG02_NODE_25195_length_666_cov_0.880071_2_plen_22_part_01
MSLTINYSMTSRGQDRSTEHGR